jgi:hypothetical protein
MNTSRAFTVIWGVVFMTCQTYDFAYIAPSSVSQTTSVKDLEVNKKKPNLMFLVDKSGSMGFPISATVPDKRIDALRLTMDGLLKARGTTVRVGLTFFPPEKEGQCIPAKAVNIPLPGKMVSDDDLPALQAKANSIITSINGVQPLGGTPSAKSLEFVGGKDVAFDSTDDRDNYVLLLTDGLPNCNDGLRGAICGKKDAAGNQADSAPPDCISTATMPWADSYCKAAPGVGLNQCLDRGGLVEAVKGLAAKNITTIVVGFGADTAGGAAAETLNIAAKQGGFTRACPAGGGPCGPGNPCDPVLKICTSQFFQASSPTELASTLADIFARIDDPKPCEIALKSQPSDDRLVAVLIDGVNVARGPDSWTYTSGAVTLQGKLCEEAKNPTKKSKIEVRVLERL